MLFALMPSDGAWLDRQSRKTALLASEACGIYNVRDRVLRTLLVVVMGVIEFSGPPAGFAILLAMLLTAHFGVDQSRNLLRRFALAAFPA